VCKKVFAVLLVCTWQFDGQTCQTAYSGQCPLLILVDYMHVGSGVAMQI